MGIARVKGVFCSILAAVSDLEELVLEPIELSLLGQLLLSVNIGGVGADLDEFLLGLLVVEGVLVIHALNLLVSLLDVAPEEVLSLLLYFSVGVLSINGVLIHPLLQTHPPLIQPLVLVVDVLLLPLLDLVCSLMGFEGVFELLHHLLLLQLQPPHPVLHQQPLFLLFLLYNLCMEFVRGLFSLNEGYHLGVND